MFELYKIKPRKYVLAHVSNNVRITISDNNLYSSSNKLCLVLLKLNTLNLLMPFWNNASLADYEGQYSGGCCIRVARSSVSQLRYNYAITEKWRDANEVPIYSWI